MLAGDGPLTVSQIASMPPSPAAVATAVLWLFAFDAQNALWALLVLPVLEGALRAELRGALITWLLLALV